MVCFREGYTRERLLHDVIAGVTVGIVALPLALGFGISSALTAEAGLVTAIVAGVLAAVLGGSNVQVSGPTGAMVVDQSTGDLRERVERDVRERLGRARWTRAYAAGRQTSIDSLLKDIDGALSTPG